MPGPDICGFYAMLYGTGGVDLQALTLLYVGAASGMVFSGNPSFTVTDFANFYPKFFGVPSTVTGIVTSGSNQITGISDTTGISIGQLLNSALFPCATLVTAVTNNSVTVNNAASVSGTSVQIYTCPMVPIVAIQVFINLALASVMKARYTDAWVLCMNLFIAHFVTMYMRAESGPNATASQVASSGLTKGMVVHRSAGDVSASSQLVQGYEQWGAFQETEYGVQFISIARAVNAGPIWVG